MELVRSIDRIVVTVIYYCGKFSIEVGINVETRSFYRLSRDFARGSEKKLNPFVRASLREKSSPKFRRVAGTRHNYSSKHGSTSLSSEKKNSKYSSRHRFKPGLGNFFNRGITFDISERLLKLPRLNITSYVS